MTDYTPSEESELQTLVYKAFDLRDTPGPEYEAALQAIVDWHEGLDGRRLAVRISAGEQFRKYQVENADTGGPSTGARDTHRLGEKGRWADGP